MNEEVRRTAALCIQKAREKLRAGNYAKARALVEKAKRIFPEVDGAAGLLAAIARIEASGGSSASPRPETSSTPRPETRSAPRPRPSICQRRETI